MRMILLIACLSLSACATTKKLVDPAALTIEADSSWQLTDQMVYWKGDGSEYRGSLGRAAIVMEVPLTNSLELRYGYEHRSYIEYTGDRGEERALIGLKWKPFKRSH